MKSSAATLCRKKFLRYFKRGFRDETYVDWERGDLRPRDMIDLQSFIWCRAPTNTPTELATAPRG